MKTFFRDLSGMLVMALCLLSAAQAQGVPGAIKYQAVLRDVTGKTLVNKNDVNIRISLRLDEPVSGTIAYSEVHEGVSTNAYGVIHLEIGRGEVTSGTTLNAIAWGEHKVYVQIEIETDGTGYTHMGNSELLTVPYAFYAENASGKNLYEHLKDNFIPKYNEANKTLVNSGLSQKDRALEVDASSITFVDRSTGKSGYTFPMEAGKQGQVLRLADNMGTLKWDTAGGGGSIGGGNVDFGFGPLDNGRMVYWNDPLGKLQTAPLVYNYNSSTKDFSLTGDMSVTGNMTVAEDIAVTGEAKVDKDMSVGQNLKVTRDATVNQNMTVDKDMTVGQHVTIGQNIRVSGDAMVNGKISANDSVVSKKAVFVGTVGGTPVFSADNSGVLINKNVSGTNNLLTSDRLGSGEIWIGDNYSNTLSPHKVDGHIQMDNAGKTTLNLAFKGIKFIPGDIKDTLASLPESDSLWARNAAGNLYAYNQARELDQTFVGIGTDAPVSMFHVQGGEVRFVDDINTDGNIPIFSWNPEESSLFAGAVSNMTTLANQGKYSISLGLDALAVSDYGLALGNEANAQGKDAVAIGSQSIAVADNSIAMGKEAHANDAGSVAIGYQTKANGSHTVVLGGSSQATGGSVVVGYDNGIDEDAITDKSIVIGTNNDKAFSQAIVIGNDNGEASGGVFIGNEIEPVQSSVVIGSNKTSSTAGQVVLGYAGVNMGTADNLVSVGNGNTLTGGSGTVSMLGANLSLITSSSMTMIGHYSFFDETSSMSVGAGESPAFVVGCDNSNPFEISNSGNAYFTGKITAFDEISAPGWTSTSDIRLKTDIKPLFFAPALLDSLQPVSFVYKSDKKRQTRFGFIAQEVREIFPELVRENAKGMLSMDYIGLVPVLWQINQQLSQKVNALEEQVAEQSRKQLELEKELEAIKAKLGM